jgi:hypothetical protein
VKRKNEEEVRKEVRSEKKKYEKERKCEEVDC